MRIATLGSSIYSCLGIEMNLGWALPRVLQALRGCPRRNTWRLSTFLLLWQRLVCMLSNRAALGNPSLLKRLFWTIGSNQLLYINLIIPGYLYLIAWNYRLRWDQWCTTHQAVRLLRDEAVHVACSYFRWCCLPCRGFVSYLLGDICLVINHRSRLR